MKAQPTSQRSGPGVLAVQVAVPEMAATIARVIALMVPPESAVCDLPRPPSATLAGSPWRGHRPGLLSASHAPLPRGLRRPPLSERQGVCPRAAVSGAAGEAGAARSRRGRRRIAHHHEEAEPPSARDRSAPRDLPGGAGGEARQEPGGGDL